MRTYVLRRLAISVPVLLGITIVVFLLVNLTPGDPITAYLSPEQLAAAGPDYIEVRRQQLGLDQPLPVRYFYWLRHLVTGDFGYSVQTGEPVLDQIGERMGPTLRLTIAAQMLAITVGITLGVVSAIKQYSLLDYLITTFNFVSISIPSFFLGLGLIYIVSLKLGILPPNGMNTVGGSAGLVDSLRHLILPALVLSLPSIAVFARYTRASMRDTLDQDYVMVARAKGLHSTSVITRHAFPNAITPLITIIALGLPGLFGGAVITEQIFSWPGMGTLAITSISMRDYPVLMGLTTITAVIVLASNLLADVLYALADPRIRYR